MSDTNTKHTPTPWRDRGPDGKYLAGETEWHASLDAPIATTSCPILAGDETVALVVATGYSDSQLKANAAFIVRACNAHDDLLAACKAMVAAMQNVFDEDAIALVAGRAAIAKAEGVEKAEAKL